MGGKYFYDGGSGGIGGLDMRFGAQITNLIGVYGQPFLQVGAGVSAGNGGGSVSAVVLAGVGALVDFTFLDILYVALGPELASVAGGDTSATGGTTGSGVGGSTKSSVVTGSFISLALRAGVALGSVKPNRRKAFTIGLDMRAVASSPSYVIPCLALGFDSF